ncbi:AraC family transcriptional regulator [Radiobacillus kanasensis]|uniref:AraC family transcriptional regulator n=1 Tax=Radiobacillus kanasensis TaxID=2844358 RepID=UPI001E2C7BE3|nr:AraC family transcriptional regulator [Radiobacillus kanasensis]UFT98485.1 AraC family transcriptional regulator [Radiobacillus kanasensis]
MSWVDSLQKAIDFIEEHLLEDITIEQIAKEANASMYQFQRAFSILTDSTVGDYVRRRRLTLAAHELTKSDVKVIDIAYKYGYDTPEAFTKAFRRQHDLSPSEARKYSGKLQSYNRLVIQVSLKGVDPMQYRIVEQEAFQIVGIRRRFSIENEENNREIPKMWDEINGQGTDQVLFSLNNGPVKGVLGVCADHQESKSVEYWIAAAHEGDVPEEFESLEVPKSKWAIFEVHGPMPDSMQNVWKQIYSEWFPSSGYQHAGTPELEVYSDDDPFSPDLYSEIWIPIK